VAMPASAGQNSSRPLARSSQLCGLTSPARGLTLHRRLVCQVMLILKSL
jgi:hypothetical protein